MVRVQGLVQGGKRGRHIPASRLDLRHGQVRRGLPRAVPGRLAERLVRAVEVAYEPVGQAQRVEALAVTRVGVESSRCSHRSLEVAHGRPCLATPEMPEPDREVAADVLGIAPERLAPVRLRRPGRMAIAFEVRADEVQLLDRRHALGWRRLASWLGRSGRAPRLREGAWEMSIQAPRTRAARSCMRCDVTPASTRCSSTHGTVGSQVGDGLDDDGIGRQQLDPCAGHGPTDRDADADVSRRPAAG